MVRSHQRFFNVMQILLDAFMLILAYVAAVLIKSSLDQAACERVSHLIHLLWMLPVILCVCHFLSAYAPMRSRDFLFEARIITKAHLTGIFIIFSVKFLLDDHHFHRTISLLFAFLGLLALLLERFVVRQTLRSLREKGYNQKHMLIIGAGPLGADFADRVQVQRDFGYQLLGFLDDDLPAGDLVRGTPVLGDCGVLAAILGRQPVDEVVVALPVGSHSRYGAIIEVCEKAGVRAHIIPDCHQFLPGSPHIEEFDGIALLTVRRIPLDDPFSRFLKRGFDLAFSLTAILTAAPVMAAIAVGIKLTSPGPLLFRQQRIGLNNRPFDMLKFRTMRIDSAATAATTWTVSNDPRTTAFGSFLRKTSLDELPQFFNVLLAHMSVIGPRPERPFFVNRFKEEIPKYMVKHQVKPGITGWAQVNGWRGDTSIVKRIECDIYYIENWALLLDIKIMFLTVFKGMVGKNAY